MHLAIMHKQINLHRPSVVICDPISNLNNAGTDVDLHIMLVRLVDFLKSQGITGLFTTLTGGGEATESTNVGISSVMDTWLLLRDIEYQGERNRGLYVIKSRGMAHSNQIREFHITSNGIQLLDVYIGPEGVLTGSARVAQEARERESKSIRRQEVERKRHELKRRQDALETQIAAMRAEAEAEQERLNWEVSLEEARERNLSGDRIAMARSRQADTAPAKRKNKQ
jgi:circadian clock protein KaiC